MLHIVYLSVSGYRDAETPLMDFFIKKIGNLVFDLSILIIFFPNKKYYIKQKSIL